MSTATADAVPTATPAPAKRGKKKLFILLAVVLIVLLAAGGGAVMFMKKKAAHAAAEAEGAGEEAAADEHKAGKIDPAHPPTFLPLDVFVVNLADKDADRYAQIGVTLEIESAGTADQIKAYLPAIRSAILLIISHKTSRELLDRAGKDALAAEIQRATVRPMGIDIPEPAVVPVKAASADGETDEVEAGEAAKDAHPKRSKAAAKDKDSKDAEDGNEGKKRKTAKTPENPVRHVHFSSFIVQ